MVDYTSLAAAAADLIDVFGQEATLRKRGTATGPAYDPTFGADESYTITCVDLNQMVRDGVSLTDQTRRTLYVSTEGLSVSPEQGDRVEIGGSVHEAIEVRPLAPGGVDIMWEVDLGK